MDQRANRANKWSGWEERGWRDNNQWQRERSWQDADWTVVTDEETPDPRQLPAMRRPRSGSKRPAQSAAASSSSSSDRASGAPGLPARAFEPSGSASASGSADPFDNNVTFSTAKAGAESLGAVYAEAPTHGKPYTCQECREGCHRDGYLLLTLCDWQGGLSGYCYDCAVRFEEWTGQKDFSFRKECQKRHKSRDDIKLRDVQRLRQTKFHKLVEEAMLVEGTSKTAARRQVVTFFRAAVQDIAETMAGLSADMFGRFQTVLNRYKHVKAGEALDSTTLVVPGGVLGNSYQWLAQLAKNTYRFFICRSRECSANGSFFGRNTDWVSTVKEGGWHFACPHCGSPYRPGAQSSYYLPGHHVWYLAGQNKMLLAEWPESAEEDTIGAIMQTLSIEDMTPYTGLNNNELQQQIIDIVNASAIPTVFSKYEMNPAIISYLENENSKRTKQKKWGWDHLADGYHGAFFQYTDDMPVMRRKDVKIFLAMMCVLGDRVKA